MGRPEIESGEIEVPTRFVGDTPSDLAAQWRYWVLKAVEIKAPRVIADLLDMHGLYLSARDVWSRFGYQAHRAIPWEASAASMDADDRKVIEDFEQRLKGWAQSYHFTFERHPAAWAIEQALVSLHLWATNRHADPLGDPDNWVPHWPGLDPVTMGRGHRRLKVRRPPAPDPQSMSRLEWMELCEECWDEAERAAIDSGLRSSRGAVKQDYIRVGGEVQLPQHVLWFVKFQVCGELMSAIAAPNAGDEAIRAACRKLAQEIGLTLRRDKPGPNHQKTQDRP